MPVKLDFATFHAVADGGQDKDVICFNASGQKSLGLFQTEEQAAGLEPRIHQRLWTAFLAAAEQRFGADRVERVWNFYGIDPQKLIREKKPLKAGYVHMLEVGTMKIHLADLRQKIGRGVADNPPGFIETRIKEMIPFPRFPLKMEACKIPGSPTKTSSFFSYDPYLMDQELNALLKDVGSLSQKAYHERLTKSIISRELPEGMIVPAPCPHARGKIDYYVVYKCVSKGDGLVAYALKPLSKHSFLSPMLVFRPSPYHPSGLDFLETWLNNMQRDIGWLGYHTARGALGKLVHDRKFCPPNRKIIVTGYSVAADHAQLFIADYYERVKEAIFYNGPSIDGETAEMFAVKMNARLRASPMKVRIYRNKEDVVCSAGRKHLFWGVRNRAIDVKLVEFESKEPLTAKQAHGRRHFDTPNGDAGFIRKVFTKGPELDKQLDNSERGFDVKWYEGKRLIWGSYIIYPTLLFWSRLFQFLERKLGITIFRHTPKRQVTSEITS